MEGEQKIHDVEIKINFLGIFWTFFLKDHVCVEFILKGFDIRPVDP